MPKRDNNLADKYELSDIEPGVDPQKAAAFLAGGNRDKPKPVRGRNGESDTGKSPNQKLVALAQSQPSHATTPANDTPELWTSRTIRLRQSTATCLTKAACHQKMKQAEGKLKANEPITIQEIADHGIRLALAELGYDK